MDRSRGIQDQGHVAKRAAILRRLVMDEWLDELDAEERVAGWEHRASELGRDRGSIAYWDEGWRWITAMPPRGTVLTAVEEPAT